MTSTQAEREFGKELWTKMINTPALDHVTVLLADNGDTLFYACDLENAYNVVTRGKMLFWD